jgi:hypothetical protein
MFDPEAEDYFSYLFMLSITNRQSIPNDELRIILNKYYKGLCQAVADSKERIVDTTKVYTKVYERKNKNADHYKIDAEVVFFDHFSDGRMVTLNMEIEIHADDHRNKLHLLALVYPENSNKKVREKLREIRDQVKALHDELK